MSDDSNVRIPTVAKRRVAEVAAAEGMSLRAVLTQMSENLLTLSERAEQARRVFEQWSGYAPSPDAENALDAELNPDCRSASSMR
ncbi:hypothetical protein [Streptomyces sp. N35]|uniref:hypothetical protein n=1 Tax=Streptomyces sp. N35 TaxID=2795730 RepID=UPI0018F456E5|nr:hypothetical protein [Streptomyces sp. N35]